MAAESYAWITDATERAHPQGLADNIAAARDSPELQSSLLGVFETQRAGSLKLYKKKLGRVRLDST